MENKGIKLDIDLDEFEKWLTPELMENAFHNAGYEVELKDEYKKGLIKRKDEKDTRKSITMGSREYHFEDEVREMVESIVVTMRMLDCEVWFSNTVDTDSGLQVGSIMIDNGYKIMMVNLVVDEQHTLKYVTVKGSKIRERLEENLEAVYNLLIKEF